MTTAAVVSKSINEKGIFVATLVVLDVAGVIGVEEIDDICIQHKRSAGAGSDTLAVTGSCDGMTYAAVTGKTQAATGGDTALSALTNAGGINQLRQKPRFLKFASSGTTDTWTITVTGRTRR